MATKSETKFGSCQNQQCMNYGVSNAIPADGNCPVCHQPMKAESEFVDINGDPFGGEIDGSRGGDGGKKKLLAILAAIVAVLGIGGSITYALYGGKAKPESVSLNKQVIELTEGDSITLRATITPIEATANAILQWQTDGSAVLISDGQVKAIKEGTATITVQVEGVDGVKAFCVVNVKRAPKPNLDVETLTAVEATAELMVDSTKLLTVTKTPAESDEVIEWSTSNETIAKVDSATGMVTAKAEGVAVLTARSSRTGKTAAIAVTVKKPEQKKEKGGKSNGGSVHNNGGTISVLGGHGVYTGGTSNGKPHGNGIIRIKSSFYVGSDYIPAGSRIEGVFREGWVNLGTLFTPDGDAVVIKDLKVK